MKISIASIKNAWRKSQRELSEVTDEELALKIKETKYTALFPLILAALLILPFAVLMNKPEIINSGDSFALFSMFIGVMALFLLQAEMLTRDHYELKVERRIREATGKWSLTQF